MSPRIDERKCACGEWIRAEKSERAIRDALTLHYRTGTHRAWEKRMGLEP